MSDSLKGKKILVTGGRQGIGRAIVDRFINEGAMVLSCGREARPTGLASESAWLQADVSNCEDVIKLKAEVMRRWGGLDVLVNNAGVQIEKTLLDTTDADWDALMGVNAKGVFLCCRELIPVMRSGGSIINLGSISGNYADKGLALYNASKAFVHGLTRSIAIDHGPQIRCNAISPGWILTDMAEAAFNAVADPEQAKQAAVACHPVGRMGQPEDVANMALWLASEESNFVTGQCYVIDGGLTAASSLNNTVT